MRFSLGSKVYTVSISSRPIYLEGRECEGRIDPVGLRIILDGQLPRHERRPVLLHELRHLWVFAHGRPADDERDADDAAAFSDWAQGQYLANGGDAVLEALNPESPRAGRASGVPIAVDTHCGFCGALVAVGSVANEPPKWSADLRSWSMLRGMLCPCCDRVTTWAEVCLEDGMPLGQVLGHPQPRVLPSSEAGQWIRDHAEACGVSVV